MHKSTRNMCCPPDYVDQENSQGLSRGSWRNEATKIQGLIDLKAQGSNNTMTAVKEVQNDSKDYFKDYFVICCERELLAKGNCPEYYKFV